MGVFKKQGPQAGSPRDKDQNILGPVLGPRIYANPTSLRLKPSSSSVWIVRTPFESYVGDSHFELALLPILQILLPKRSHSQNDPSSYSYCIVYGSLV